MKANLAYLVGLQSCLIDKNKTSENIGAPQPLLPPVSLSCSRKFRSDIFTYPEQKKNSSQNGSFIFNK